MHPDKAFHINLDEYLDSAGRARGRPYGKRQRARIHELAPKADHPRDEWFRLLRAAILEAPQEDTRGILQEFVAIALYAPGQRYPVPDAIVEVLFSRALDEELFDVLDQIVCEWFSHGGAYSGPNWKRRGKHLYKKLPSGLRLAHNLMSLESEVHNGGFVQFFGNSSGKHARETLEDCRLVGAVETAALLKRAIALEKRQRRVREPRCAIPEPDYFSLDEDWRDNIPPETEMDRLDSAYYALADAEPIHRLVATYLRAHPDACITSRRRRIVKQ
jgi:hypothetical protein